MTTSLTGTKDLGLPQDAASTRFGFLGTDKLIPTKHHNPCDICYNTSGKCREVNDLRLCMHYIDRETIPGYVFVGVSKDGLWGLWVVDKGRSASAEEQAQWRLEQYIRQQQRQEAEALQQAQVMPAAERDRHYRRMQKLLTLHPLDRADLHRRGLSDEEIEAGGFVSVEKWQKLPEEFPTNLPGIQIDGRSLNVSGAGYLCPILNQKGELVAWQLRLRDSKDGRYRWLSSRTQKLPYGQSPHLPNGELPLAVFLPEHATTEAIAMVEGTGAKPFITSNRLGIITIGAAGGQFSSSPKTLRSTLKKVMAEQGTNRIRFFPDAGSLTNLSMLRRYGAAWKVAEEAGGLIEVGWWGQESKGDPDIDELEAPQEVVFITPAEFLAKAPENIRRQINTVTRSVAGEPDKAEYALYRTAEEERARVEAAQRQQKEMEYLERCLTNSSQSPPNLSQQDSSDPKPSEVPVDPAAGAIALYDQRNDGRLEMSVSLDTIPTVEEWINRGRPTLIFKPEERVMGCVQLVLNGFRYVLLKDTVGGGKSRTAGEFFKDWDQVESILKDKYPEQWKGFYAAGDYRRPSHEFLEAIPEAVSGAGEMLDESKRTPLNNPYRRRAKTGETPDIPGLCIHEEPYQELNAQGFTTGRGHDSPFCQNCPQLQDCPYLEALDRQKNEPVLRTHLSKISVEEGENAIAFIDEAGREIKDMVTREAPISAIDRELGELLRAAPQFYREVAPVLKAIKQGIERAMEEQGTYGLPHRELMAFLPDRVELERLLMEAYWQPNQPPNPWEIPSLNEIAGRLQRVIRHDIEAQLNQAPYPKERIALVTQCLTIGVLPRLLRAIDGRTPVDVSITDKKIRFRYRDRRHEKTIAKLRTAFLMDATPDTQELAHNLGISANDILCITSPEPSFENLTFKVVKGFGKAGRNREHFEEKGKDTAESHYSLMTRIKKLVGKVANDAWAENPNQRIGILDLKAFIDRYHDLPGSQGFLMGYHFHDGRNTNRFKECSILFSVGSPVENIGDLLSQWHLRTGQCHTVESAPAAFWAWVNRRVTTELIQEGGRSRAQHRPQEAIVHYILTDLSTSQMEAIAQYFPGCRVEEVNAYDICPEAAPKGEQTRRGTWEAIAQAIRAGTKPTISEVASQVGVSKSRISQILSPDGGFRVIVQSLIRLYEALNNQTKLSDLLPEQVIMAYEVFPTLVKDLESGADPEEALEEFLDAAEQLGYESFEAVFRDEVMLSAIAVIHLTRLIGFFLTFLPRPFLERLKLIHPLNPDPLPHCPGDR